MRAISNPRSAAIFYGGWQGRQGVWRRDNNPPTVRLARQGAFLQSADQTQLVQCRGTQVVDQPADLRDTSLHILSYLSQDSVGG